MLDFMQSVSRILTTSAAFGIVVLAALSSGAGTASAQLPEKDLRADKLIDADHYELRMPEVKNLQQWEKRKQEIQRRFLLTAGLWPPPEKPPLKAHIFDERRGKGFRVAKVYFESLPGYYVTGNLTVPPRARDRSRRWSALTATGNTAGLPTARMAPSPGAASTWRAWVAW